MVAVPITRRQFDSFDVIIGVVSLALAIAIGGVVLIGDRAGVGVTFLDPATQATTPVTTIHSTSPLRLAFSEAMDTSTVHLRLDPPLEGKVTWSGAQLTFTPARAFTPGATYMITLEPGAQAQSGRAVQQAGSWQFKAAPLSIVYMGPANRDRSRVPVNLWRLSPDGRPVQITHSEYGVYDFAPSPDGTRIAFTQKDATGKTDLYVLTVLDGTVQRLTQCVNASCRAPSWSPDGGRIVYERGDSPRLDGDARAWIVDVKTLQTEPLLTESRWLGKSPRWSPDGKTISLADRDAGGIFLYDVASGNRAWIETLDDDAGQFAPGDQKQLVYRQLSTTPNGALWRLELADFGGDQPTIHPMDPPDNALVDDRVAVWNPDGKHLAVMRRYLDSRATEQAQIYQVDAATGESQPLVVDPNYAQGAISWSPDGSRLLFQRYPAYPTPKAETSIWIYDAASKSLTQVASDGFFPQWLP